MPGAFARDAEYQRFADPRLPRRGLTHGNELMLLPYGCQAYAAMLDAIRHAQWRIDLCVYIFRNDPVGRLIATELAERAAEGVRVRVAYDWVGCMAEPTDHFEMMSRAGAEVLAINPMIPRRLSQLWHPNTRDHRKVLVVDDRVAFLGGRNIGREYSGHGQDEGHWADYTVRMVGPAGMYLRRLIDHTYENAYGHPPPVPSCEGQPPATVWLFSPEPMDPRRTLVKVYESLLRRARRSVWIVSSYFLPNLAHQRALGDAVRRGVDVRLILPSVLDVPIVLEASRTWYAFLLSRGVRIYERQGSMLHAKVIVADGVVSLIGSANFDVRSNYLDREVQAMVFDRGLTAQLTAQVRQDMDRSREILRADLRSRSTWQRVRDGALFLLSPLL